MYKQHNPQANKGHIIPRDHNQRKLLRFVIILSNVLDANSWLVFFCIFLRTSVCMSNLFTDQYYEHTRKPDHKYSARSSHTLRENILIFLSFDGDLGVYRVPINQYYEHPMPDGKYSNDT